ncbi:arylsulfatase [Desertivirga arenae]|uniref:arylsulfatase n=1 Tax=Desertivirga arenae TaxID=2810309 RepID=UPI001A95F1F2|nr:arylsulfatase [Pedobacter sp. SYSU D00823]
MSQKALCIIIAAGIITSASLFAFKQNPGTAIQQKDTRPNIIVILADDLGYSDLGCYGGEVETPNLDYLAAEGIRFRSFYNTSRCCPTRASLLTGIYNHNAGIGEMTASRVESGYRGYLTENTVTLAEVLKTAGYRTAMTGKWHVSNTVEQSTGEAQLDWLNHKTIYPAFSPLDQYPTNRGFEKYFGTLWGVIDFYDPFSLVSGTTPITQVPKDYYHTDAINDTTCEYIREFSKGDKPFFLYVAQNAPHWPLQAKNEDIEKYKDTYKAGWDEIRKRRYERMVKMGLIDSRKTELSPPDDAQLSWDKNLDKDWDARAMAVHAAMIDAMDQGIGRILRTLKETGELENTLIVFLSDNGASPEDASAYGPGFDRPSQTREGRKIVYPVKKEVLPGPQTTFASIGRRWANVANTPYQYAKMESYEGGVRTPMIAYWPRGIKARKGSFIDQLGHITDFMKTFVELANATYPTTYRGHRITPMQGESLVSAFRGLRSAGHEALFNEHYGARYARYGEWKIVSKSGRDSTWHLYKISEDQAEMKDLSRMYPEKVKEMSRRWLSWAVQNQVFPKPGTPSRAGH